ncbi:hypothetical protein Tsubulata_012764 [Turnera subulata]|uniref:Ataxin 2 SM domain-containing protein n=1 Tax=Turnera subulata TaxID=218843 RepID=A0A9Q0FTN8_9ROSI|nr:hypothetical protein Tsubulata_012764 [Turnera subulata]
MGYKNRAETETEACLSEALLFATMCIIGLPVEVHVRDGSVYSGTFHTASVGDDYGIVLKEAKLTKKGKCGVNVANGSVIETLVILSDDLVQVIAKGVQIPADGVTCSISNNDVETAVSNGSCTEVVNGAKKPHKSTLDKKKMSQKRYLSFFLLAFHGRRGTGEYLEDRNSAKNKNGSAHFYLPTKGGKQHEGTTKLLPNHIGNSTAVEKGKSDGMAIPKRDEVSGASVNGRQTFDNWPQAEQDHYQQKFEFQRKKSAGEVQSSTPLEASCLTKAHEAQGTTDVLPNGASSPPASELVNLHEQCCGSPSSGGVSSPNAVCSSVSTVPNPVVTTELVGSSSAVSTNAVSPQPLESSKSSKEFKLNPGAKIFSPTFSNPISAGPTARPTVSNVVYIPSNSPVVPVAAAQQEVSMNPFAHRPSIPTKFSPYSNLTALNGGNASQFSQPIVGNMGSRTQPLRYTGQYHSVQAGSTYLPPSSPVVVGRLGQLVCVQPVPHLRYNAYDNGAVAISPGSAHPLLTSNQIQYPKYQGSATGQALQLYVPPPLVAGGQQPFAITSPAPHLQPPIPFNRSVPVPAANAVFSTKFP